MEPAKIKIVRAQNPEDFDEAKKLILEYVNWFGIDLSFQNFDNEINDLGAKYAEPDGKLLFSKIYGITADLAIIRKFENKVCDCPGNMMCKLCQTNYHRYVSYSFTVICP